MDAAVQTCAEKREHGCGRQSDVWGCPSSREHTLRTRPAGELPGGQRGSPRARRLLPSPAGALGAQPQSATSPHADQPPVCEHLWAAQALVPVLASAALLVLAVPPGPRCTSPCTLPACHRSRASVVFSVSCAYWSDQIPFLLKLPGVILAAFRFGT